MCADSDSEDEAILAPPPRKLVAAWDGGRVRKLVLYEWSTCLQAAHKRSVVSAQVVYTELRLMQTRCMRAQHAMQMSSGLPLSAQHLASVHRVMSQRSSDVKAARRLAQQKEDKSEYARKLHDMRFLPNESHISLHHTQAHNISTQPPHHMYYHAN